VIILAGGLTRQKAERLIESGAIDLAGFGEPFIANPDLVTRLRNDLPFTPPQRELHYGLSMKGYLDWKAYGEREVL
jgi:N-ethylmaleimide reductase